MSRRNGSRKKQKYLRTLGYETLQTRSLLAVDVANTVDANAVSSSTHTTAIYDIDQDGAIKPLDALFVINATNSGATIEQVPGADVNHDGVIKFDDAHEVFDALNQIVAGGFWDEGVDLALVGTLKGPLGAKFGNIVTTLYCVVCGVLSRGLS